jgi:hypothetical protein
LLVDEVRRSSLVVKNESLYLYLEMRLFLHFSYDTFFFGLRVLLSTTGNHPERVILLFDSK